MRTAVHVALIWGVVVLATGCPTPKTKDGGEPAKTGKKEHAHPGHGPHGGALAEWGEEEYHAEFIVDHGKKQATVYVLDGNVKKAAPIAADSITVTLTGATPPVQIALKADPQEGDPKGQASRFTSTHDEFAKEGLKGEISGTVAGTPYAGTFVEAAAKRDKKQ